MSTESVLDQFFRGGLHGKTVIVVGGGSRMGLETAKMVAQLGAKVIISSRSLERLSEAGKTINGEVEVVATDFSIPTQADQFLEKYAPFDHLVLTASANSSGTSIPQTSPSSAQAAFSRFWMAYNALHFSANKVRPDGSITLLSGSSSTRRAPLAGYGIYSALHGSIEALAKAAALELAPIRVNVVSPGGIGMRTDRQLAHHAGEFKDVAMAIVSLMCNPAITATITDVDGGERLGNWP
jgi:NAD(P)-dependent dehydrogenase (short-subunit alcohol dehydrogenase family)